MNAEVKIPETLEEALEVIKNTRGQPFFVRQAALHGKPSEALCGGNWTGVDFGTHDVTGYDFRNCLFDCNSDLSQLQNILLADFRHSNYDKRAGGPPRLPDGITAEHLGILPE